MNWFETSNAPAPTRSDTNEWVYHWAQQTLTRKCLEPGSTTKAPVRVGALGAISDPEVYLRFVKMLDSKKATLAEESIYVWDNDFEEVRVWETGASFISSSEDGKKLGINVVTSEPEFADEVREFLRTALLRRETTQQGKVYMLAQGPEGISPVSIGFGAVPLDIDNYDKDIQAAIQEVIKELTTQWPSGRLTIFEGPPGCGKTFLIRSLIHEVPKAKFIFVPPNLVQSLGDPSFTSALLKLKDPYQEHENFSYHGPTVLICEDADSVLVERAQDNMPAVSAVLNLTAGILGDVIDVRIIATTNANRSKIEPALLRSGRLSHYVQVGPLSTEQATNSLSRLMGSEQTIEKWPTAKIPKASGSKGIGFSSDGLQEIPNKVLLADVFKEAKARGWEPVHAKGKPKAVTMITRRTKVESLGQGQGHASLRDVTSNPVALSSPKTLPTGSSEQRALRAVTGKEE